MPLAGSLAAGEKRSRPELADVFRRYGASFEQTHRLSKIGRASGLWPPIIMRATHGLGNPYVVFAQGEGAVEEGIGECKGIPKVNGREIDTTFFLSGANGLISAVLYSDCSFFSLGFDLFGESMLIHNPKAYVPLHPRFLGRIAEIWTICCLGASSWRSYRINSAQPIRIETTSEVVSILSSRSPW